MSAVKRYEHQHRSINILFIEHVLLVCTYVREICDVMQVSERVLCDTTQWIPGNLVSLGFLFNRNGRACNYRRSAPLKTCNVCCAYHRVAHDCCVCSSAFFLHTHTHTPAFELLISICRSHCALCRLFASFDEALISRQLRRPPHKTRITRTMRQARCDQTERPHQAVFARALKVIGILVTVR